jgi:uncharacterized damage-inducible protein DinB
MQMKSFFIEIFDYQHKVNLALLAEIEKHYDALPAKTFPLLCHNLNAHQIWNARINNSTHDGVFDEYSLEKAKAIDMENYKQTVSILDERNLDDIVEYSNSKNDTFTDRIKDILFHVANHHTHHRGQIISDFRASGIQPLVTDYIFQKRLK